MGIKQFTISAIIIILSLNISVSQAQNPIADGMNSLGLSDSTAWAAFSNPANLASAKNTYGIGARSNNLMPELNRYYLAATIPLNAIVMAADAQYQGYTVWQEKTIGLSLSRKLLAKTSVSAKVSYQHIGHGDESQAEGYFFPQVFISTEINDFTNFYGQISPAGWLYSEKIPVSVNDLSLGGNYRFSSQFYGFADVAASHSGNFRFSVSAQYAFVKNLSLRAGVANDESPISAGISAGKESIMFDLACRYHRHLGVGVSCGLRLEID